MTELQGGSRPRDDLHPISCEACRTRKRKCNRKIKVDCIYPEISKRGIPSGYISSLEHRLVETEVALYLTVNGGNLEESDKHLVRLEEYNAAQTRAARQATWNDQPVVNDGRLWRWTKHVSGVLSAGTASREVTTITNETGSIMDESTATTTPRPQRTVSWIDGESKGNQASALTQHEDHLPPPAKRSKFNHEIDDETRSEVGVMRRSRANNAASFVGSASGIPFVRAVYNAIAKGSRGSTSETQVVDGVPAEDDQIPGPDQSSLWQEDEVSSLSATADIEKGQVSLAELAAWTQSYFDLWQPAYPFVEIEDVQGWFERMACGLPLSEDQSTARHRRVILQSILSISLADRRQSTPATTQRQISVGLVFPSFSAAMESCQSALVEPPSLESLQATLSVQLFLISMLRHNAASRLGGLVIRMIFQMGLHRCPARYSTFSPAEVSLRRRVFYAAYCIDRHVCQSLGLPLTLSDGDIDVCQPGWEQHLSEQSGGSIDQHRFSLPDFLARHGEIVGLIMELRNKSINHRQTNQAQATHISAKISKWANDVAEYLESVDGADISDYHQVVLKVLNSESIIALHRPMLSSKVKPDRDSALQTCIGASRVVISTLHKQIGSPTALAWPSLTWAVWMSALIVVYAALEGEIQQSTATRMTDQAIDILKHLACRGSIWPNACAAAVRDLTSHLRQAGDGSRSGSTSHDGRTDATLQSMFNDPVSEPGVSGVHDFGNDLFGGYDIPYWMGENQYGDWMSEWVSLP